MKKTALLLILLVAVLSITGCTRNAAEGAKDSVVRTIKIGLVGEMTEMWDPVRENLEGQGIEIKIVKFSDYTLPNQALEDGEIDLNAFQHYAFLYNEIEAKGLDLTAIGDTIIAPLNVYSSKIKGVSEISEGDKIAIPNDVTNGGRALKVLESAGLIEVAESAGYTPSLQDITSNPLNLELIEVEASNIPSLLPDVTAAVINGNHAHDYGLVPAKDAIYSQGVDSITGDNPYINIIVARTEEADDPDFLKIVEAYNKPNVAQVINETFEGLYIPAWTED